jgi:hypothetical protein
MEYRRALAGTVAFVSAGHVLFGNSWAKLLA